MLMTVFTVSAIETRLRQLKSVVELAPFKGISFDVQAPRAARSYGDGDMYSALAGIFMFLSIGILLAHAMERLWIAGRSSAAIEDTTNVRKGKEGAPQRARAAPSHGLRRLHRSG